MTGTRTVTVTERLDTSSPAGPAEAPGQRDLTAVSFEDFYREHVAALRRSILGQMPSYQADSSLADDIVQDTFMAAIRKWDLLREFDPNRAMAWLRTTASNRLIDSWRRERHVTPTAELPDRPGGMDLETAVIAADTARHELELMPPARRRVMALVMEGLTSTEIADLTGMTAATVRSHLRDARKHRRPEDAKL